MSEILNSLGTSVAMLVLAWIVIVIPTGAALAYRLGWSPAMGALLGCVPIPFVGWLIVAFAASPRARSAMSGAEELLDIGSAEGQTIEDVEWDR